MSCHEITNGIQILHVHDFLIFSNTHTQHNTHTRLFQDMSYWTRTGPMNHMTVHIAVDEQTTDNGGLEFVPGSHRWTRVNANGDRIPLPITDSNFSTMESIQSILSDSEKTAFRSVPGLLSAGEASFHHPLLVHGSYSNRSAKARRAAVVNYFADGTQSYTNEPLLKGVPPAEIGDVLGQVGPSSRFFPLVFDPRRFDTQSN